MRTLEIKGWLATDKCGTLNFFSVKPERYIEIGCWWVPGACIEMMLGFREEYKDLTWQDEPIEATLTINSK